MDHDVEVRITDRQRKLILRAYRAMNQAVPCERALGMQLVKKKLMIKTDVVYKRYEWQRVVASLPVFALTKKGIEVAEVLSEKE